MMYFTPNNPPPLGHLWIAMFCMTTTPLVIFWIFPPTNPPHPLIEKEYPPPSGKKTKPWGERQYIGDCILLITSRKSMELHYLLTDLLNWKNYLGTAL